MSKLTSKQRFLSRRILNPSGEIDMYYSRIGSGKTYAATTDVLRYLSMGRAQYVTWPIDVSDFDDRNSFFRSLWNIFVFNSFYLSVSAKNLHFIDVVEETVDGRSVGDFWDFLSKLTDCDLWFDDTDLFDSYEKTNFSKQKRRFALHTRHYSRNIHIVVQRPTAIQVSFRSQVNRFYKFTNKGRFLWIFPVLFLREEYQDMIGESVSDGDDVEPVSTRWYFASSRVFRKYDTHFLRRGAPSSQQVIYDVYDLSFFQRIRNFFSLFRRKPPL